MRYRQKGKFGPRTRKYWYSLHLDKFWEPEQWEGGDWETDEELWTRTKAVGVHCAESYHNAMQVSSILIAATVKRRPLL